MNKTRHDLYHSINYIYSLNYSCLRISSQDTKPTQNEVYGRNEIFNKSAKDSWVQKKLNDVTHVRNNLLSGLDQTLASHAENIKILRAALEETKEKLTLIYNIWFETNKSIDDLFDGFVCKDPELSKLTRELDTKSTFSTDESAIMHLMNFYAEYIDRLFKNMVLETYYEITSNIRGDINGYGRPTMYYGQNSNPNLVTLSKKDIDSLYETAATIGKNLAAAVSAKQKEVSKLQAKSKKKSETITNEEIVRLKTQIADLTVSSKTIAEAVEMLDEFKLRLAAANKDIETSSMNPFVEGFMDLMSGINIFSEKKPEIKTIYAHKLEMNYLQYLFGLIPSEYHKSPKAAQKSFE